MAAPINKNAFVSLTEQVVAKLTSLQDVVQQLCCPRQDSPQIEEKAIDTQSNLEAPEL
jgi:hypothetical protein